MATVYKNSNHTPKKTSLLNKKLFWKIFTVICLLILLISLGVLLHQYITTRQAKEVLTDLQTQVNQLPADSRQPSEPLTAPTPFEKKCQWYQDTYGITIPHKLLDFQSLRQTNQDVYAWIYIPGTDVDYPVLQHPEDDSYYLMHNLNGSHGYPGCIYSELVNTKTFADSLTVLYGHDMPDDTMFSTLARYQDKDFFDENRYIYIYLPDDVLVYEVFSTYLTGTSHLLKGQERSEMQYLNFLESCLTPAGEQSNVLTAYQPSASDRVLALSTCLYQQTQYRRLVLGVLLDGSL